MAKRSGAPLVVARISGVRGAGRVVSAVLMRSRARLSLQRSIRPEDLTASQIAERVQAAFADGGR